MSCQHKEMENGGAEVMAETQTEEVIQTQAINNNCFPINYIGYNQWHGRQSWLTISALLGWGNDSVDKGLDV